MWMCPPCHQSTPPTSSGSAGWTTSCSGLRGQCQGTTGLASFPGSGSDRDGGRSSPSRTGEQFSFNTTAAQPQVRSVWQLALGRSGDLGAGVVGRLCWESKVGCTLAMDGLSGNRSSGPEVVRDRQHGKCRGMGSGCYLPYSPLGTLS